MKRIISLILLYSITVCQLANAGMMFPFSFFVASAQACQLGSGGTITYSGSYTIHTFTSSGTFTPSGNCSVDYLAVGAGGGGGANRGGGGGGGQVSTGNISVSSAQTVTINPGGAGGTNPSTDGGTGGSTIFGSITAIGGAGGGSGARDGVNGGAASGGGAGNDGSFNGAKTGGTSTGQFAGGNSSSDTSSYASGGGGGGCSAVGANSTAGGGGVGGAGCSSSISGSSVNYAGGGGGAFTGAGSAAGGSGGGGAGGGSDGNGVAATANTGGGGGASGSGLAGKIGGSGIVIIRYIVTSPAANTLALLDFESASQVNDFGIGAATPWTLGGSTVTSTTQAKFGTRSLDANGGFNGAYTPNVAQNQLSSGDFTVEFWLYVANSGTFGPTSYGYAGNNASGTNGWAIRSINASRLQWMVDSSVILTINWSASNCPVGAWCHVAFVRSSGTLTNYLNGTSVASVADATNYNGGGTNLYTGYDPIDVINMGAGMFMDEFRISNVARWTANFTPPTIPYTHP